MKTIKNLFIVFALTATFAFADGHTNGGNRCDTCTPPPPCTENCGGFAPDGSDDDSGIENPGQNSEASYVEFWSKFFFELIG